MHAIVTKPMNCAALVTNWDKMKLVWQQREKNALAETCTGDDAQVDVAELKKKVFIRVGIWAFKMAQRGDQDSSHSWLYPMYIARLHEKLGSDLEV